MHSMRDLRRRIRSIGSTTHITKAMQMVAASKMRKAQQAASPPPVEPVPAAAQPAAGSNGGGNELTPEVSHVQSGDPVQATDHPQTAGPPDADPTAGRPAQAGGADERRT